MTKPTGRKKTGRPRKPKAVHDLQGTARKDRGHTDSLELPPLKNKRPPALLTRRGKAKWRELVAQLGHVPGLLSEVDRDALTQYCDAWEDFCWARDEIDRTDGRGIDGQRAFTTKSKAVDRMRWLASQFGLTPSARAAIKLPSKKDDSAPDDFAKLLQLRQSG